MLKALANAFAIPELRKRLVFTLAMIAVYELGTYVPTPGIDGHALSAFFRSLSESSGGTLFDIMNLFSGGAMSRATIFALGIMPYITASIILQLLTVVIPALDKMQKDDLGRQQITQYTRYGTVGLAFLQSFFIATWLENPANFGNFTIVPAPGLGFRLLTAITLTSGTAFIMWLGEQITERGIGNGISLVITVSIISRIPPAGRQLVRLMTAGAGQVGQVTPLMLIVMVVLLVFVVGGVVLITLGERRIPVQYARRMVGRKVYGGQNTYIPLRVNQVGVIPIIFAQSLLLFPATIAAFIPNERFRELVHSLTRGNVWYILVYAVLIIFFSFFYAAITFNPVDVADNMKKYGGFVPGIRPGRSTAEYLDFVLTRITTVGAITLAMIAVLPDIITSSMKLPFLVSQFFGGAGLLIIVGVLLDTVKQLESHLLMRNYEGFMRRGHVRGRR